MCFLTNNIGVKLFMSMTCFKLYFLEYMAVVTLKNYSYST